MNKVNDLIHGNITQCLIKFAIPFLLANFVQFLYGTMDMAILSWFTSNASISAVNVGTQVMQFISSLVTGLTMGATILVAMLIGSNRREELKETVSATISLFIFLGTVVMLTVIALTPNLVNLLRTPTEAVQLARNYIMICGFGIIFTFGYNAIAAILRGMGDSKNPLIFISVACVTNIVLDFLFIGTFKMDTSGAALATTISQGISFLLAIIHLQKSSNYFDLRKMKMNWNLSKIIMKIGIPVSFQEAIISISFIFITAVVNTFGVNASAAIGICSKFEALAMLPASAFGAALSTFVAQNMSANKEDRAIKSLKVSIGLSFAFSVIFFVIGHYFPNVVMSIFNSSPEVALAGSQYLLWFSVDFILVAFGFTFNGFYNGCGKTVFAMLVGVIASIFVRIPLTYLLVELTPGNLTGIGIAIPIATTFQIIVYFIYLKTNRWKNFELTQES